MTLGAIWCPLDKTREIFQRIREIKAKHRIGPNSEVKWKRVSPSKTDLYLDLIDYFFDDDDLCFRGLVVPDKSVLDHQRFEQSHDDWYYKMYFQLLSIILGPGDHYRIYLDVKDTRGGSRVRQLHQVLSNSKYDFERRIITSIQLVRSHEIEILQIADLLIGALSYASRDANGSLAKLAVVDRIKKRTGYSLSRSTLYRERKMNLFFWEPSTWGKDPR
jgi:hypothetical protein